MKASSPAVAPLVVLVALVSCHEGSSTAVPQPDPAREPFLFVDIADQAGLSTVQVGGGPDVDWVIDSVGSGGAWLDYDDDGDADLYLAQGATDESPHAGPPDRLFRNDGDTDGDGVPSFTDVTSRAGLGDTRWSFGVAAADYDNDGDTGPVPDELGRQSTVPQQRRRHVHRRGGDRPAWTTESWSVCRGPGAMPTVMATSICS